MANVIEDSPAWDPDADTEGLAYYNKHKADTDIAPAADLALIAQWLFADPTKTQQRVLDFNGSFANFKPDDVTTGSEPNRFVHIDMGLPNITLGHAQCVMLWHALWEQKDLKLVAPVVFPNFAW